MARHSCASAKPKGKQKTSQVNEELRHSGGVVTPSMKIFDYFAQAQTVLYMTLVSAQAEINADWLATNRTYVCSEGPRTSSPAEA